MALSHLPAFLTIAFAALAHGLDSRSATRLPRLLAGILFAGGRRTVTSWFRAAGITDAYRPAYSTVCATGRHTSQQAVSTLHAVRPLLVGPRLRVAKRAGQTRGGHSVECVPYGPKVTKTIQTFLATWKPAGGVIRVVIVQEEDDWLAYFSVDPEVTAVEILEAMADRGAEEQTFQDVKEVWGAGQQQVRNVHSNEGCFNLNLWMYSLVEAWAWQRPEEELVDRSASPWDSEPRRPSPADKRKRLQREVLQGEIDEALAGQPSKEKIRGLTQRLLDLAA